MTVSVQLATVCDSISKLSISGVTIKDIDQITASRIGQAAILTPKPDGFVTGLVFAPDSFGPGATRLGTLQYTLTYRYYHCAIGQLLDFGSYAALVANVVTILNAILTNDIVTGCVDVSLAGAIDVGPVTDPAGNSFHGADIALLIKEFVN
jgi:hypothetical protein